MIVGIILDRDIQKHWEKKKNLSTTNPTCTAPRLKQGLCSKKLETACDVAQPKKINLCPLYDYSTHV
jgi:hypothetical protein